MTRLSDRKTRLTLITNAAVRYRGRERSVVIEVSPDIATIRLLGTRTRYEVSWRGVYDYAAQVKVDRDRRLKRTMREAKRKGIV